METRLHKAVGYLFCLIGLFFFIKNIPFIWYLNSRPHSVQLNGLQIEMEYLYWIKFVISFSVSVISPFCIGLYFLRIKKSIWTFLSHEHFILFKFVLNKIKTNEKSSFPRFNYLFFFINIELGPISKRWELSWS